MHALASPSVSPSAPHHSAAPMATTAAPPALSGHFVSKLYGMLEDASNAHLIAWTEPNGMSFQVLAPTEFSLRLLPTQFKHKNFSSFIRQLNMYGFSKLIRNTGLPAAHPPTRGSRSSLAAAGSDGDEPDSRNPSLLSSPTPLAESNGNNTNSDPPTSPTEQPWEFKHPLFQRGRWDLLGQIKRKSSRPGARAADGVDSSSAPESGPAPAQQQQQWAPPPAAAAAPSQQQHSSYQHPMPPRQSPPRQAYPDLHDSEYPDPKRPRTSASLSLAHRQHSHQQQAAPTSGTSPLAVRFGSGSPPPVTLHHLHHPHSANGATALPTPDLKEQVAWLSAAAARLSSLVVAALPRDSPHAAEAEDIEHELACIRDALHPLPPPIAAGAGPYSPHPVYPSPVQYHPPPMTTTKATTGRMNGSPSLPPPPLQTTSHSQYHHHLPHPHATSALPLPSAIRRQCHPYQHHQHAPFGSAHTNGGSPPTPISVTTVSVPATAATLRASMSSPAPGHQYHHFRHQQHHSAPPAWPPATATPPESSTPEVSLPPPQTQSGRMYKRSYRPWEEDEDAALPERLSGEDEQQQNVHMYRAPPPLRTRPNMADVL